MAQLYRKSALERMSSPEQLDQAMQVTSPLSWLALIAVTVMILITVIWSIVGKIPVTVTAKGIISSPSSTNAVFAPESGTVDAMLVSVGSTVDVGTPVMNYRSGNGEVRTVYSDQYGVVASLLVEERDKDGKTVEVKRGEQLIRLSPRIDARQVVVSYVKQVDASKLKRGMEANVSLTTKDASTYGHMRARIINIDSYVSEDSGMAYVLGKDSNQIAAFRDGNAVVAVTLELLQDSSSASGYYWSNEKGRKISVADATVVNVKYIVEEIAPITKLFTKLRDIWGAER